MMKTKQDQSETSSLKQKSDIEEEYKVPNITPKELWSKSPQEFNDWRVKYDYPRILNYLKDRFPKFDEWKKEQRLTIDDFAKYSIGIFLRPSGVVMIYKLQHPTGRIHYSIRVPRHKIPEKIDFDNIVLERRDIVPYDSWIENDDEKINTLFHRISYNENHATIDKNFELLHLGNITVPNRDIQDTHLDFVNIGNLTLDKCSINKFKLYYSIANNFSINGNAAYVDIYKTNSELNLNKGVFQDWEIENSDIKLKSENAKLWKWCVKNNRIDMRLTTTEIQDCDFGDNQSPFERGFAGKSLFHKNMKIIYSNIGDMANAGKHFYREKRHEMTSSRKPDETLDRFLYREKNKKQILLEKVKHYIYSYIKYISLSFQMIFWGFGEKPFRILIPIFVVIFGFSFFYYFSDRSYTCNSYYDSIYFSIVTFTTLGYGDIVQQNNWMRISSALQSFLGVLLIGFFLGNIASKSKNY